jgi:hypothetical protein
MRYLALLALACSTNIGPTGPVIGGACVDDLDCAAGSFCYETFEGGTCTTTCERDDHCRGASACVELGAGLCLLTCTDDEDCGRDGYTCEERSATGTTERVDVCVGD